MSAGVGFPKLFYLLIRSESFERHCRFVSSQERHVELAFCGCRRGRGSHSGGRILRCVLQIVPSLQQHAQAIAWPQRDQPLRLDREARLEA